MKNYLKSEFYQLSRRKLPFVVLLIGFLLPAAVTYFALTSHLNELRLFNIPFVMDQVIDMIVQITTTLITTTAPALLFLLVFVGFNNELKNRLIINSVSSGISRLTLYIGKAITIFLYSLCFLFLAVFGITLVLKTQIDFSMVKAAQLYIEYLLPFILIYISNILIYLAVLFRFENPGMAIFAFAMVNILPQFFQILDFVLKSDHWFLKIKPYFFTSLNPLMPIYVNSIDITQYVAAIYLIIFAVGGYYIFKQSELK